MSTRRYVAIALLSALVVAPRAMRSQARQSGAKADVEAAIHKLEQSYIDARLKADTAALRTLLADDFMAIGVHGEMIDKATVLKAPDRNASGDKFTAMEHGAVTVRISGPIAIATALRKVTTEKGLVEERITHVYVDRGGVWQLMSSQATIVAK
ncbi:MAG TPA: nuclear transport factor 2 family protein [Gemmatimonadaceae bacterium]|nr:nuclear transport factor 2 family protein [Gemmatimonadaceae bacterium]